MKRIIIFVLLCAISFSFSACGKPETQKVESNQKEQNHIAETEEDNETEKVSSSEEIQSKETSSVDNIENESSNSSESTDGMRPEFKAAMDSYEAFYDEYCDFMKKYKANPTDTTLISEYADMMKKLVDMDESFKEWEGKDLNNEELKYYIDVSSRISQKLIDVAM